MSASYAQHHARKVRNATTVEEKLDELAKAIEYLAKAIRTVEDKIK